VVLTHLKRSGGARQRHRFFLRADDNSRTPGRQDQVALSNNGVSPSNGSSAKASGSSARCPRRVVLLRDGEESEAERVLLEYHGSEVSGKRLHADVQRLAAEHRGRCIAAEWLGPLGWTRFLWCRRELEQSRDR
jgi:hypothetical protein